MIFGLMEFTLRFIRREGHARVCFQTLFVFHFKIVQGRVIGSNFWLINN